MESGEGGNALPRLANGLLGLGKVREERSLIALWLLALSLGEGKRHRGERGACGLLVWLYMIDVV